jgi:hypothetical protein
MIRVRVDEWTVAVVAVNAALSFGPEPAPHLPCNKNPEVTESDTSVRNQSGGIITGTP